MYLFERKKYVTWRRVLWGGFFEKKGDHRLFEV